MPAKYTRTDGYGPRAYETARGTGQGNTFASCANVCVTRRKTYPSSTACKSEKTQSSATNSTDDRCSKKGRYYIVCCGYQGRWCYTSAGEPYFLFFSLRIFSTFFLFVELTLVVSIYRCVEKKEETIYRGCDFHTFIYIRVAL